MAPAPAHQCAACDQDAVAVYQRHASGAELAGFAEDLGNPSVQAHEEDALVAVYVCAEHAPDKDAAARIHQHFCRPPCSCEPDELVQLDQPPLVEAWQ